ncbi:MAG: hypothetical protein M3133_00700 [Actinomycetota bacterium]|nr:hypothetical protein [Actinomycetota bacterium]
MARVPNVNDLLEGHVTLDVECLDRIYLNAYVPNLQVGGQVVTFLTEHLGFPVPSPALFNRIGTAFRQAVSDFAAANGIPVVRFRKDDRKADVMKPYLEKATTPGVVAIGVAQEFQSVFTGYDRKLSRPGAARFAFQKADRRVSVYYFYVRDDDFGPGFIKICSYFPYPAKVWVNGHEWAKRQAAKAGLGFTSLANGFASCDDPDRLQAICDRLGPNQILVFFERWMSVVPTPLSAADRAGGYWWELSMRQIEVSRTIVFDAPRRGRAFFEAMVADNLDIGRPSEVRLIFDRQIYKNTKGTFRTRVVTRGTEVTLDVNYRDSRIKEYLKEGRALPIETVVNSPDDLGVKRRLTHLDELQAKARAANRRLLELHRVGQSCAISTTLLERVGQPSVEEGQRAPALRFGDPRVMALAGALCALVHAAVGFTNRSLCARVRSLLGGPYTSAQMTYDLRRLRLKGLVRRLPHSNTYVLTPEGARVAIFYTKVHDRLLGPLLESDRPPAPLELRQALKVVDESVASYIDQARLRVAA